MSQHIEVERILQVQYNQLQNAECPEELAGANEKEPKGSWLLIYGAVCDLWKPSCQTQPSPD